MCGGRDSQAWLRRGGGAVLRVGGRGELVVAVVLDLSLNQLISCPHELWVPCEVVPLGSCARRSVPGEREESI